MNKLQTLINNFNTDCFKQYTNVSAYLGNRLDESLQEIEKFFYSDFWLKRFHRRLHEEHIDIIPIQLDIILGVTSLLIEDTKFKLYNADEGESGISDNETMIALNQDMSDINDYKINTVIMHEFGHRQYNQKGFQLVIYLNKQVLDDPITYMNKSNLVNEDIKYFSDGNEIRQRIIPVVKEMYDNDWTLEETYINSNSLKEDDICKIYSKEYIIKLLANIL